MDVLAFAVAFLARHRFAALTLLVMGPLFFAMFSKTPAAGTDSPSAPKTRKGHLPITVLVCLYVVFNLMFGTWLADSLVNASGVTGKATITAEHATSSMYNNQRIHRFDVLLSTVDGRTVQTSFEDDDFNVYPHHNLTRYPGEGDIFNVRYLPHFPKTFVIIANDDSPWATGLRCGHLQSLVSQAESKHTFAPGDAAFRRDYHNALATLLNANCPLNDAVADEYRNNLAATADTP